VRPHPDPHPQTSTLSLTHHHNPHHNQRNKEDLPQTAVTLVKITKEARLGISRPAALVLTSSATGAEAKAAEAKAAEEKAAATAISVDDEKAKHVTQYSKNASQVTYPVHSH
jgi:hypothetical protein